MCDDAPDLGLRGLDHVCLIVRSVERAVGFFSGTFGLGASPIETFREAGIRICFVDCDGIAIELIEPLAGNTAMASYLQEGDGRLHHIAFRVEDIEFAIRQCLAKGLTFAGNEPAVGAGGARIIFTEPNVATGIPVELVERPHSLQFDHGHPSMPQI